MSEAASTRDRLLDEAMRLFGEDGYTATSIAEIESAAGLAPGSGGLYKHFRSKEALLDAGLNRLLARSDDLTTLLEQRTQPLAGGGDSGARQQLLEAVAGAGLARMQRDRDLNRLLFRGLDAFPDLMRRFADEEIRVVQRTTAQLLRQLLREGSLSEDWDAVAAVLIGATAHYWVLKDLFDGHPSGVDESRYTRAVARLAAAVLDAAEDRAL